MDPEERFQNHFSSTPPACPASKVADHASAGLKPSPEPQGVPLGLTPP
ncbi:MAG: hypothetical protein QXK12_00345 [Candidatus Nezhaarchaeales archaeon]